MSSTFYHRESAHMRSGEMDEEGRRADEVGASPDGDIPISRRRNAAAPPAVADQIASAAVKFMSRTAIAIQNDMLV